MHRIAKKEQALLPRQFKKSICCLANSKKSISCCITVTAISLYGDFTDFTTQQRQSRQASNNNNLNNTAFPNNDTFYASNS